MPNWVDCELSVCGDEEVLKRFMEAVASEKSALDANKLLPYPEEWAKLDKISQDWDDRWSAVLKALRDGEGVIEDEKREEAWKKFKAENGDRPKDGYNQGGYEWCVANWGMKWNFGEVQVEDEADCRFVEYGFQTAWSPPIPLVRKMAEMFPELSFQLRYYEGGNAF